MDGEKPTVPDVLVLAAGGVVGEAWMSGMLAGLTEAWGVDFRRVEQIIGTSAGSIVAASLVAGRSPRRPRDVSAAPSVDSVGVRPTSSTLGALARGAVGAAAALTAPLAPAALALGAPGGAFLRARALARVPTGRRSLDDLRAQIAATGARFDGRLRVVALDRASGRRVVFGAPGAPRADVADAVAASCAIPWVFAPVLIDGRAYVDGGVWSLTNLDVARVGRGSEVLCLSVANRLPGPLRAAAAGAEALEAEALRRQGAHVRTLSPDAAAAMGADLMDPRHAETALAAGHRQGRATAPGAETR